MSLMIDIKRFAGNIILKREIAQLHRAKTAMSLTEAKSFAIIFEASRLEDVELVKKYVTYLKEMKKHVKVIGFLDSTQEPSFTYSKLEYEFFNQKALTWYLKPVGSVSNNFVAEEFDVLIDLNLSDQFPLKFISSISKAKFKVGRFSEENKKIHDLLIDTDEGKTFKYFLRQVDIYLGMINNKTQTQSV